MPTLGVIPARLQSSRLPEKLLLRETGRSLLEHTYRAASRASSLDALVVATDSSEIAAEVKRFGGAVEMTGEHPSGTDRLAEVARRRERFDVLVNVQGDEPEIDPAAINLLAGAITGPDGRGTGAEMATLCSPMTDPAAFRDPANVKVVCAPDGRALYFSRAPIPFPRDSSEHPFSEQGGVPENARLHIGAYAYRREFLIRLSELPPSRLERVEKLEQLRALEAGCTLRVCEVAAHACGVDTREDYNAFVARHAARAARSGS
ncbi:3-deoxy-manno-octulosonate cytidylyltransferase [Alienimonas californiensis]|uniref:3-deoxy-manno-octulosonate cytidylyltransferase n=1 Tax=Alienimonas californiensis TaxID=2527989 RepID=A0A517P9T9_9PLAN|nr:3-deoxy-manno-octulosonate cytidylyltransferase [Alienimonas californiensis]QDT16132.1 3-deoxy-manno-octulosonate cytidylyltransferase [Alienimonas californiensis]